MSYFTVILVLSAATSLSGPETINAFEARYPGSLAHISHSEEVSERSHVFDVAGTKVFVGYTTEALDPAAYEFALETHGTWSGAMGAIRKHDAHVIIGLEEKAEGHDRAIRGASAVLMVAGALDRELPVEAAFFVDSQIITDPGTLRTTALALAEDGEVAADLWVSTNPLYVEDERGKTTPMVITRGLRDFVGREIEFAAQSYPFDRLIGRTAGLVRYLIEKGPVIKDGDAINYSPDEKIFVRHLTPGLSGEPSISVSVE